MRSDRHSDPAEDATPPSLTLIDAKDGPRQVYRLSPCKTCNTYTIFEHCNTCHFKLHPEDMDLADQGKNYHNWDDLGPHLCKSCHRNYTYLESCNDCFWEEPRPGITDSVKAELKRKWWALKTRFWGVDTPGPTNDCWCSWGAEAWVRNHGQDWFGVKFTEKEIVSLATLARTAQKREYAAGNYDTKDEDGWYKKATKSRNNYYRGKYTPAPEWRL